MSNIPSQGDQERALKRTIRSYARKARKAKKCNRREFTLNTKIKTGGFS